MCKHVWGCLCHTSRSISGIKACEQRVLLQPSENYLFYIKAVCEAGASEQSEAALISTKGWEKLSYTLCSSMWLNNAQIQRIYVVSRPSLCFQGRSSTCWKLLLTPLWSYRRTRASSTVPKRLTNPAQPQTKCEFNPETPPSEPLGEPLSTFKTVYVISRCPSILGELLPARGLYYWETVVSGSTAYRLGVAYSTADRNSSLGENGSSWCLQCTPAASGYALETFPQFPELHLSLICNKNSNLFFFVCPVARTSYSTMTFSPRCVWLRCLSEWALSWITSSAFCLSTMPKVVRCWVSSGSASRSPATLLWPSSSRAACSSAWCRRCRSLPRTASSSTSLTHWKGYRSHWTFVDLTALSSYQIQNDHHCRTVGHRDLSSWVCVFLARRNSVRAQFCINLFFFLDKYRINSISYYFIYYL